MTKVKVFVYGRRQQQWQRQCRGYDNSSLDFRHVVQKMNRAPPLIINNLTLKFEVNKQEIVCIMLQGSMNGVPNLTWTLDPVTQNQ